MSVLKFSFVALCSFGFGVALMDTLQPKKACGGLPPYAEALRLTNPLLKPDMTVQQCTTSFKCGAEKRYYTGMRK